MSSKKAKKNEKVKKTILNVLMVICLGVFCYSGYQLYDIWKTDHQVKSETSALQQYLQPTVSDEADEEDPNAKRAVFTPDWAGLQAQNPAILGWIIIPGTDINYPIVQGEDNTYYLTHTAMGEDNYIGGVFMDAYCQRNFSSDNTLIYAHSVDIGGMFTQLDKFKDEQFFNDHPYFWILTPEQNYRCEIAMYTLANPSSAIYTIDYGDYSGQVTNRMAAEAEYKKETESLAGKKIVSLSTCNLDYGYHSDHRLVLTGILDAYNDPVYQDMVQ